MKTSLIQPVKRGLFFCKSKNLTPVLLNYKQSFLLFLLLPQVDHVAFIFCLITKELTDRHYVINYPLFSL